jgi:cellulose synthase/poly-beta-1,6-N-acetylglucosamine synthase-like glycosyltransferase
MGEVRDTIVSVLGVIQWPLLAYMIALNAIYTVLIVTGWRSVHRYVIMRPLRDYAYVGSSPLSMPVSILVPAHNEEPTIVDSVRALLRSRYGQLEIVVINDGSTDETIAALTAGFGLVPVERVPRSGLATAEVRGVLASTVDDRVVVIDKAGGGKADALNCGINYAQFPLVCAIDADTLLDTGALSRLVWEFQSHPGTVATGGIVRVVNGSIVEDGLVSEIHTPRTLLENIQVMEYLRAFLGGRLAWSRWNMLLIISGAFGLFRRDVLVEAGGYDTSTVSEDAELILRVRRDRADRGLPCRITFFPDPICWTQAPNSARVLARQRDRWQRGLGEMLLMHRRMLFRRRYGRTGWIALPYYWLFEFLEPVITVVGVVLVTIGLIAGSVEPFVYVLILTLATAYGLFLSLGVILIEERAFRRYPQWRDLLRLSIAVLAENFGYRQWQAWVRFRATGRALFRGSRHRGVWGAMPRSSFTSAP